MKKYILIILLASTIWSCSRAVYVPVESVRTEYKDRIQKDSVHILDSVFYAIKGDTIFKEKYRTIYMDKWRSDSIFIQDTIRVPYPVEKVVKVNELNLYQKTAVWVFSAILFGIVGYIVIWLIKKRFLK